ncbi:hypothetical protein EW146_g2719 [Bondarzewia mesenterica]|uniref:HMG box domain-containing protein n=1 Tax=Bondarzewia mesenterica TaxID=1095465 RepID=A0A4S4M5Y5_9AGAM|nr:hypothetical protein EW146_g2719 [Bondarzewia mesenterica]
MSVRAANERRLKIPWEMISKEGDRPKNETARPTVTVQLPPGPARASTQPLPYTRPPAPAYPPSTTSLHRLPSEYLNRKSIVHSVSLGALIDGDAVVVVDVDPLWAFDERKARRVLGSSCWAARLLPSDLLIFGPRVGMLADRVATRRCPRKPRRPRSVAPVRSLHASCAEPIHAQRKAAGKSEKAPRAKKVKDPKAPKRAMSAYMFFSQDWRERIRTENPDASFGEVGKLLGAKWKELDESEKKPYIEQAARDKQRAEQDKAEYEGKNAGSGDGDEEEE